MCAVRLGGGHIEVLGKSGFARLWKLLARRPLDTRAPLPVRDPIPLEHRERLSPGVNEREIGAVACSDPQAELHIEVSVLFGDPDREIALCYVVGVSSLYLREVRRHAVFSPFYFGIEEGL